MGGGNCDDRLTTPSVLRSNFSQMILLYMFFISCFWKINSRTIWKWVKELYIQSLKSQIEKKKVTPVLQHSNRSASTSTKMHITSLKNSLKDIPADSLPRCLVKLPNPPNETGDCMPLASPNYREWSFNDLILVDIDYRWLNFIILGMLQKCIT